MSCSLKAAHAVVSIVDSALGTSMQIAPLEAPGSFNERRVRHVFAVATTKKEALELARIIKDLAEDLPDASRTGPPRVIVPDPTK